MTPMTVDWRLWREKHPRLFVAVVALKRARTKVGLLVAALCLAEGVFWNEPPFDLDKPNG